MRRDYLDQGYVELVDYMGDDQRVVESARISFKGKPYTDERDTKLIHYLIKNGHCVVNGTKVLTADLQWKNVEELVVGERLLAFDEEKGTYVEGKRSYRSFKFTNVVATGQKLEDVFRVTLDNGDTITCTGDHKWLCRRQRNNPDSLGSKDLDWLSTTAIAQDLETHRLYLPKLCNTWETVTSYDSGYIAGAWDADGCLSRRTSMSRLQFAQYNNPLLKEVQRILTDHHFTHSTRWSSNRSYKQAEPIAAVSITGGFIETIRFLGTFRPKRIMPKWLATDLTKSRIIASSCPRILSVEYAGKQLITLLSTEAKTYIADGYFAHNTSPLEQVIFVFRIKLPIFVMRQLVRHRTARINEVSGRYTSLPDEFYIPSTSQMKRQDKANRQGSAEPLSQGLAVEMQLQMLEQCKEAFELYRKLLNAGLSREMARIVLPLNTYTEIIWQMDLNNLLKFLDQRLHPHAQWEMQELARLIKELIQPIVPRCLSAWEEKKNPQT